MVNGHPVENIGYRDNVGVSGKMSQKAIHDFYRVIAIAGCWIYVKGE